MLGSILLWINKNTQYALLKMIETWRSMLNKGIKVRPILMDFSKPFDMPNHNFFLCKLKACGFDTNALTFIQSYFSNRHQKIKAGDKFREWQKH